MFGIGFFEICIILIFGLVLFGPQKAPELMQKVGRFLFQMKKVSNEVKSSVEDVMTYEEVREENSYDNKNHPKVEKRQKEEELNIVAWNSKDN